jgi:hypothetical protein
MGGNCFEGKNNCPGCKWTKSIAVGGHRFIENVKTQMGFAAIGRRRIEVGAHTNFASIRIAVVTFSRTKRAIWALKTPILGIESL